MQNDPQKIDRARVAKDWHHRGFSCGMWIDHARHEWTFHGHPHQELLMVISGMLEIDINGRLLRPRIGEEVCIPAGTPHTIKNVGEDTARWLYGQFRRPAHSDQSPPPSEMATAARVTSPSRPRQPISR